MTAHSFDVLESIALFSRRHQKCIRMNCRPMQSSRAPAALRGYARVGKVGGNEKRETSAKTQERTIGKGETVFN